MYAKLVLLVFIVPLFFTISNAYSSNFNYQTSYNAYAKFKLGYQDKFNGGLKLKLDTNTAVDKFLTDSFINFGLIIEANHKDKKFKQKSEIEALNFTFPIPTVEALQVLVGRAYDKVYDNSADFVNISMDAGFGVFTLGFKNRDLLNLANYSEKPKTRFYSYSESRGLIPGLYLSYFTDKYFNPKDKQPSSNFFFKMAYDFSNFGIAGHFLDQKYKSKGYGSWIGFSNYIEINNKLKLKFVYSQSSKKNIGMKSNIARGAFGIAASKLSLDVLSENSFNQASILRFANARSIAAALSTKINDINLQSTLAYNQNKSSELKTIEFASSIDRQALDNLNLKAIVATIMGDKDLNPQTGLRLEARYKF